MAILEEKTYNMVNSHFKTTPYKNQINFLQKYLRYEYVALDWKMGTGKTWAAINNATELWAAGDCNSLLVFAPNGVHLNWVLKEIPKHVPDWVRYRAVAWTSSQKKKDREDLEELFDPKDNDLRILTVNWEAIQSKRGFDFVEKFCIGSEKLMIVCDESDSVKNPKAARTKALMKLKKYSTWRRIMSGTMINNSPFDLYSQYSFLDESILQTTSFYAFKSEYAEMIDERSPLMNAIRAKTGSRFSPQVIAKDGKGKPKYRNLDRLKMLIQPYTSTVLKEDCLDLPDKIYKTVLFEMTKEQKEVYKIAKEKCRLVFAGEETPFAKLVAFTKLAQITSGYFIHPFSDIPVRIQGDNPKLSLLGERVAKIVYEGSKVIVWARYRIEIFDIVQMLNKQNIPCVEYHGGVKQECRVKAIDEFENGDCQVFVGNQQAGGTGITLIAASYVVYFSNNFSLRDRLQSEDRAHRIGQTKSVTYINIAAKETIDEHVIEAIASKQDIADSIVGKGMKLFEESPCF